jgi:hypothetical protein
MLRVLAKDAANSSFPGIISHVRIFAPVRRCDEYYHISASSLLISDSSVVDMPTRNPYDRGSGNFEGGVHVQGH